jgi:predicted RNA-binding Zn-ribbon protein involved in translation (DUF1610 family)
MKNADGVEYETPYAVICEEKCGTVCLSEEEHSRQLGKPDHGWVCPKCGGYATWDDDAPITNPAEEDE